jgi:ferrous iron transport protein B
MEIALFGNPNSGKTTLFNELTGGSLSVGNWTGTTVNVETGHFRYKNQEADILDLPGVYSLLTASPEQMAGCLYLRQTPPDVIVNIVDATNLERNLYLTTQLVETGLPVVVALNMNDELQAQGVIIDTKLLSGLLGVPCVKISSTTGQGLRKLLDSVLEAAGQERNQDEVKRFIAPDGRDMLEKAAEVCDQPAQPIGATLTLKTAAAEERYQAVTNIVAQVRNFSPLARWRRLSKKIDAVVCHRVLALPIFFAVMFFIFFLSFGPVGNVVYRGFDYLFRDVFATTVSQWLAAGQVGPVLSGLIVDGIIRGVGAVMAFLPQLAILFFCLALLEFSGYIARAAFITDKFLAHFGLSGMSFIPMILGFGCSVPAIMACRSLHHRGERLLTMMIIPFISCSARMTVFALLAATFFNEQRFLVIFLLYVLGVVMAFITSLILSPFLLKGHRPAFLMEMPPYRKPVWHCVWRSVWVWVWDFLSHAGTVILIAAVAVWFLSNFNASWQMVDSSNSLLGNIGRGMAPLFAPLGFGYWQIVVALILGFMSKEAVISTLAVLYAGTATLSAALATVISPLAAFALMVFILLYTPCIATLTAMHRESGSWGYTLLMMIYQFGVAWLASFLIYHFLLILF